MDKVDDRNSCHHCEEREMGCHIWCKRYEAYCEELKEIREHAKERVFPYHEVHMDRPAVKGFVRPKRRS